MPQIYMIPVTEINHPLDLKASTLSVLIFLGQPNLERILVSRNFIMTESVAFLEGVVSIYLVK